MRYLLAAPMFGVIGWLFGQSVLEQTGSDVLAALIFGLTAPMMRDGRAVDLLTLAHEARA